MSSDPSSIYVQFVNEFKKFKYWVWDSFDFSGMTVDQAIEIEAPNHVIYEPQDDEFDYLPVVTFSPEEEFDDHKVYAVYIYDEIENSYFVTKFASDTGLIRISSESYGNYYRHYYQKNVFYRKVMDHSIDFFNLNENPHVCKNSFKDFHLIPVLRPWNSQGPLNLLSASIPNTDRRIDISSHLQEDKKQGIPTGEWEFYIDHEKWESWTACYRALVHYFHGFKMAVRLKDHELDRIYQGRITVKNYAPGNDYSKIILEYQLFQDQVSDPSKLGLCFQIWWLDWDRKPVSYETIYWSAKPSSSSTSSGTNYTPSPRNAFDNQTFVPDLPEFIRITHLPNNMSYYEGNIIDYSGISVTAYNSSKMIWSGNSLYISGLIPYSELSFPISIATINPSAIYSSHLQTLPVLWQRPDDLKILSTYCNITVEEVALPPAYIKITKLPNKINYSSGDIIDYTGIEVVLTDEQGNIWTNDEYTDGKIPFEELIFLKTEIDTADVYWTVNDNSYVIAKSDTYLGWLDVWHRYFYTLYDEPVIAFFADCLYNNWRVPVVISPSYENAKKYYYARTMDESNKTIIGPDITIAYNGIRLYVNHNHAVVTENYDTPLHIISKDSGESPENTIKNLLDTLEFTIHNNKVSIPVKWKYEETGVEYITFFTVNVS